LSGPSPPPPFIRNSTIDKIIIYLHFKSGATSYLVNRLPESIVVISCRLLSNTKERTRKLQYNIT
jgi:hypothetical protein